jgi:hypothetical protein
MKKRDKPAGFKMKFHHLSQHDPKVMTLLDTGVIVHSVIKNENTMLFPGSYKINKIDYKLSQVEFKALVLPGPKNGSIYLPQPRHANA